MDDLRKIVKFMCNVEPTVYPGGNGMYKLSWVVDAHNVILMYTVLDMDNVFQRTADKLPAYFVVVDNVKLMMGDGVKTMHHTDITPPELQQCDLWRSLNERVFDRCRVHWKGANQAKQNSDKIFKFGGIIDEYYRVQFCGPDTTNKRIKEI